MLRWGDEECLQNFLRKRLLGRQKRCKYNFKMEFEEVERKNGRIGDGPWYWRFWPSGYIIRELITSIWLLTEGRTDTNRSLVSF